MEDTEHRQDTAANEAAHQTAISGLRNKQIAAILKTIEDQSVIASKHEEEVNALHQKLASCEDSIAKEKAELTEKWKNHLAVTKSAYLTDLSTRDALT